MHNMNILKKLEFNDLIYYERERSEKTNNRKNKRASIQVKGTIGTNGLFCDGLLMDFSKKGLGLLLDHNEFIDIGQKLNIIIETSPIPTTAQGVIKWAHRFKEEKLLDCAVGMELVDFDIVIYGNLMQHAEL